MIKSSKLNLLSIAAILSLLAAACGTGSTEQEIATSVALTVQAQNTEQAALPSATIPAALTLTPTLFPTALNTTITPRPTSPPPAAGEQACMSASLESETIPDGTIMMPGQQFTKIWRIKNTSSCTWTTSYKIVFWDGEVMGGGYVYNFPQQALPGDTVDVPLVLTAPSAEGNYTSSWKLQTPGGASFGVGYDTPFWVDVVVSADTDYEYGITEVTYEIIRDPEFGCPANVFYRFHANVTANGPLTITYNFAKSDGTTENKKIMKFTQAGTQETVTWTWSIHLASATNPRWIQFFTVLPTEQYFGKASFHYTCGAQ
jgi:hypothetical protein